MVLANYERNEMGLSASQARLLTITSRKSDCEFQSMRYSHEKIALSRNMTDISNEYQNALNQTKLVYDFYGTNDRSTPLSYALMMEPSIMNNYLPMLTTNSAGKVVLDSRLAAAARAAGIPNEGLGTLPSEYVRNKFLAGLGEQSVITPIQLQNFQSINYNQSVGQGNTDPITQNVLPKKQYSELLDMFGGDDYQFEWKSEHGDLVKNIDTSKVAKVLNTDECKDQSEECKVELGDNKDLTLYNNGVEVTSGTITLKDLLTGDYTLYGRTRYEDCNKDPKYHNWGHIESRVIDAISGSSIWDQMEEMFTKALGVNDPEHQVALNYAIEQTRKMYDKAEVNPDNNAKYKNIGAISTGWSGIAGTINKYYNENSEEGTNWNNVGAKASDYIGYYIRTQRGPYGNTGWDVAYSGARDYEAAAISVSNVAKSFLTYFAEAMSGFEDYQFKVDDTQCNVEDYSGTNNIPKTNNQSRTVKESKFINNSTQFGFDIVTDTTVNTGEALVSSFYDALFNQLCQRGWVENDKVRDNDYLQEMYKNGMMFLTTCTDDGFYWQGNYAANSMIKEVTDEDAIARAEAKYNTEKQKINHKEEIIDLKMKNLDTEISSLSTEYDTIKSLISKNIERGFKRYDA